MRTKQKFPEGMPGPYEAIVIGHLDPSYMGTLKVELLRKTSAGNEPERSGQLLEAKYLSPFYGVTPQSGTTGTYGYQSSQKSYGMWFVPPDVGTRVIVILLEGNLSQAYWIGCVQDQYMNFMTPGYASTKNIESATGDATGKVGKKVPVSEYNKKREAGTSKNPTRFLKPPHVDYAASLQKQGLIDDDIRGTTSSSARREVPSSVFGISTPGPVDKRTSAPKADVGDSASKINKFINRLGGTSFVMDDGDDKIIRKGPASSTPLEYENIEALADGQTPTGDVTLPANELTRIRTRTGHQILLHNTEDLIYIGNARGTSWIEMTSNGKIDIYAQDSISVHTSNDLNFTADRDINFTAAENVNFMVGKDFKTTTGDSIHNVSGLDINNTAGQSISEIAGAHISNYANLNASYQSVKNTAIVAGLEMSQEAGGNLKIESLFNTEIKTRNLLRLNSKDYHRQTDYNANIYQEYFELTTGQDFAIKVDGELEIEARNKFNLHSDEVILQSDHSLELHADNLYSMVDNKWQVEAGGETKFYVNDTFKVYAQDDIKLWSRGNTEMLIDSNWLVDCNQGASLTSVGQFNISSTNNDNTEDSFQQNKGGIRIASGAGIHIRTDGGEGGSGDIKIDSSWGFDITTENDLKLDTKKKIQFKSLEDFTLDSAKKIQFKSTEDFHIDSAAKILQKAGAEIQLKGSKTELQPSAAIAAIDALETFALDLTVSVPDLPQRDIPNNTIVNPFINKVKWYRHDIPVIQEQKLGRGEYVPLSNSGSIITPIFPVPPTPAIPAKRAARVPMHEPWYQHENLDPLKYTPDKTRAGQEQPESYNPEIPDTFASTPTQYDSASISDSVTADLWSDVDTGSISSTGYTTWLNYAKGFPITEDLAKTVFVVLSQQYGSWSWTRSESIPSARRSEESVNLCRQRYAELAERTDTEIKALIDAGLTTFMNNVYGPYTNFGKAIGNVNGSDAETYRGRGPYLGIVGRGNWEKHYDYIIGRTGIDIGGPPSSLNSFGHGLVLASFVYHNYKDHGRGMLGNTRIMFFGDEDYDIQHRRDEYAYKNFLNTVPKTRENQDNDIVRRWTGQRYV